MYIEWVPSPPENVPFRTSQLTHIVKPLARENQASVGRSAYSMYNYNEDNDNNTEQLNINTNTPYIIDLTFLKYESSRCRVSVWEAAACGRRSRSAPGRHYILMVSISGVIIFLVILVLLIVYNHLKLITIDSMMCIYR